MTYSVFLSHATKDLYAAKSIKEKLKNAFPELNIYLAVDNINSGDEWKNELKENLKKCDAIITVISGASINRPWVYVEWSAFWLADKPFYLLLLDDTPKEKLIAPMTDRQVVHLGERPSIESFFLKLSRHLNSNSRSVRKDANDFFDTMNLLRKDLKQQASKTKRKGRQSKDSRSSTVIINGDGSTGTINNTIK